MLEFVQSPVEVTVIVSAALLLISNIFPPNNSDLVAVVGDIVPPVIVTLKLGPKLIPALLFNVIVTFLDIFFY